VPPKWALLAGYWVVQAGVVYVLGAAWLSVGMGGNGGSAFWSVTTIKDFWAALGDGGLAIVMSVYVAVVTALQAVLVQSVRRPVAVRERGSGLWASILVAALAIGTLWLAAVLAVVTAVYLWRTGGVDWMTRVVDWGGGTWWVLLTPLVMGWAVATPLLVAFCRGKRREAALSRVATRILQGTAVEVMAIIPLEVMVRRKTNCQCDTATFWALTLCGTVGVVVAGPAVLLGVLCKRRARWYRGRCEACGYDMSGLRGAERCPECGCGWAPQPART
jgi:hypothetical protein